MWGCERGRGGGGGDRAEKTITEGGKNEAKKIMKKKTAVFFCYPLAVGLTQTPSASNNGGLRGGSGHVIKGEVPGALSS